MPKFNVGDVVVPKLKNPLAVNVSLTHLHFGYTGGMIRVMMDQQAISVSRVDKDRLVGAGNWNWHPDDLELYRVDLENK